MMLLIKWLYKQNFQFYKVKGHTRYDIYISDGEHWNGADAVKYDGKEWVPIKVGVK